MNQVSDYLYRKASILKIPLNGTFEISPVCNFSCKMCYVRKTMAQVKAGGKELIEWTRWLELGRKCKEAGMLFLLLTGGEPFIYPNFRELYTELHKLGLLIAINSNGTMISQETVEWLKKAVPTRINITLYGASPETYEKICGNPDGYEKAVKAILMLKEAGIPVVINASMIPENSCDLEKIMEFGKKHHIYVRMATYMFPPVRREQEVSDSRFTPEESAEMYWRKGICQYGEKRTGESVRELLRQSVPSKEDDWGSGEEFMRCRAGRSSFWISWEGVMTACGMMPFPLETYPFEQPFPACWQKLTGKVRETPVLRECAGCEKREVCRPCAAMMYSETGDVNKKSAYLCELANGICRRAECQNGEKGVEEKE